ncbi:hypothetical protein KG112_14605 [Nocardioides sp. zg-ZUI104]|uniref:NACHT domain-containing protein n=1 Tax=Nocardioides faecalis TaxID=2803858 RepID=UPI001BCE7B03|nr:AAA family ATPase [Nocardioides faecalis]MBS4754042.1 hypothetical protein [Nocardioides faecalis]
MPDDETRYLYERLDSGEFQQLVSALLANHYPDFRAFPIGQADGGRDGTLKIESPKNVIVFQDKWTKKKEKDPVTWLKNAVEGEKENIKALAAAGVTKYMLVTNLSGTSMRDRGQMDRLDAALRTYEAQLGMLEMECIWRPTLNAWVAGAPRELKWSFAEMLAGWDLIRYLISEDIGSSKDTRTRHLLRKIAEVAWDGDEKLKFDQLAIGKQRVATLFVDVGATRLSSPKPADPNVAHVPGRDGALGLVPSVTEHLLGTSHPMTLVLGAPGQGKSTLTQYLCQSLRARFVSEDVDKDGLLDLNDRDIRFPVRVELGMYTAWYEGEDVFDEDEPRHRRKTLKTGSIESFLAEVFARAAGDSSLDAKVVDDLLKLVPTVLVFDGLDEVGNLDARKRAVKELERFCSAARAYSSQPLIIVTSRPNANDLPEPSRDRFDVLSLEPFTDAQIQVYMRKWCAANDIKGAASRHVRKAFRARAQEAYIGELAANPMQLTILLDLLNRDGKAAPTQRTDLYDSYVELLLIREANKHPTSVKNHKDELRDIVPFLGWYIQSRSEDEGLSGRMSKLQIQRAMEHFQNTYDKSTTVVDELLAAASDRLWALTSKEQDTYEFDIQSLREYFAAQFLYRFAGEENPSFNKVDVLRELLRRPFWFNTARFYGGNADTTHLYVIAGGIEEALAANPDRQTIIASWTLLTDGVFRGRPRQAQQVLEALTADEHLGTLLAALHSSQIVPVPSIPTENLDAHRTWVRLTTAIVGDPSDPYNAHRIDAIHQLLRLESEFRKWWLAALPQFIGTANELAWLRVGARYNSGAGHVDDDLLNRIDLATPGTAAALLETALSPAAGGAVESRLLKDVLDGQVVTLTTTSSLPAAAAVALSPTGFFTRSDGDFSGNGDLSAKLRSDALRRLRRIGSPYEAVAKEKNFRRGQQGSTFPWANTATALFEQAGHCWLASEIAIIGAAHHHNTGAPIMRGTTGFGPDHHPATLLREIREKADNAAYWRTQLDLAEDDLTHAEWSLALWAVGQTVVLNNLLPTWEMVVASLPPKRRWALFQAMELLVGSHVLRRRPITVGVANPELQPFIDARTEGLIKTTTNGPAARPDPLPSLAQVARDADWLQVDVRAKDGYR